MQQQKTPVPPYPSQNSQQSKILKGSATSVYHKEMTVAHTVFDAEKRDTEPWGKTLDAVGQWGTG